MRYPFACSCRARLTRLLLATNNVEIVYPQWAFYTNFERFGYLLLLEHPHSSSYWSEVIWSPASIGIPTSFIYQSNSISELVQHEKRLPTESGVPFQERRHSKTVCGRQPLPLPAAAMHSMFSFSAGSLSLSRLSGGMHHQRNWRASGQRGPGRDRHGPSRQEGTHSCGIPVPFLGVSTGFLTSLPTCGMCFRGQNPLKYEL